MCTAITYQTKQFYFGRTLDYDCSYGEEITISPRRFPFSFRHCDALLTHHAIIGMAHIADNYPLYYDAVNEKGLGMAGLNFVGNAHYNHVEPGQYNIAPYEFIPWILGQCATVKEARLILTQTNLAAIPFNNGLPLAQLHWLIADASESITVEAVSDGLKIYDNPLGVLTNNPAFPQQLFQLNNFMHLSPREPENHFSNRLNLSAYSRGMGALGLPGDCSSQSRFVRASFVKMNSVSGDSEEESVNQFFHILGSVEQVRGCCILGDDTDSSHKACEITLYTSCCSAGKGIYYYTTYDNHQISAVDMHRENLDSDLLIRYPLIMQEGIHIQNVSSGS